MHSEPTRDVSPYFVLRDAVNPAGHDFDGSGESRGGDLRDYWQVVFKHRRLLIAVFLLVVCSDALLTFMTTPMYTALSTIQIEREAPKIAPVQDVQQSDPNLWADKYDYYQTQYEILANRSIAARVIHALRLDGDARFTTQDKSERSIGGVIGWLSSFGSRGKDRVVADEMGVDPRLIDRYLHMLRVDPVRNSRLVEISITSRDPALSAQMANRHVEEYMSATLEQRLGVTLKAKEFLESELAKAKGRVDGAEAALNRFRKDHDIISIAGDKSDVVSERLGDLNQRFTEAQSDRIKLEGQYTLIRKRDYHSLPDVVSSPLVASLKQDLAKIATERAELAKRVGPRYPKMQEAVAREREAKSRLDAEVSRIVAGIESSYLAARNREDQLGRELEKQRKAALTQKDVGADYDTLKRDVDTTRGLYANLLQRLKDIDVAEEVKISNVSVVSRAAPPLYPSRPKKLVNLSLGVMLGLILGVGLAFLIEHLDDSLRTIRDVEDRLGLPTLGIVPTFGRLQAGEYGAYGRRKLLPASASTAKGGKKPTELVVYDQPLSVVAEAYRTIRTSILMSDGEGSLRVIAFTSSAPGEGKTVTAVNQAMTLVQSGGRVLLVDADIRKPRLHRIFSLPNGHGLSSYLAGQSQLEKAIHTIPLNGSVRAVAGNGGMESGRLSVLTSGPLAPNPAELLGSRRMRELVGALRGEFDYVLVDTPPVLPVTDAVVVANLVDGVVVIVRSQETPARVVDESCERLRRGRARILGVVLNDVDITQGAYSKDHRYYYSYYSSAESGTHA